MPKTILIGDIPISFDRRSRSLKLKASEAGVIKMSAPPLTPRFLIKRFIKQNQAWITKHRDKASKLDRALTDQSVQIFGKKYSRKIITPQDKRTYIPEKNGVFLDKEKIVYFPLNPNQSVKKLKLEFNEKLKSWLKRACHTYISQRTQDLAKKMKIDYQKITLKQLTSRWGSCSTKGNLNFNWRLVHFSPPIIDYVIIHELAHRVHPNHSKSFWQQVAKYDAKYKYHRKQLSRLIINKV